MNQAAQRLKPASPLTLESGTIVGKYRLVRRLAQGGMAQLWAGEPVHDTGVTQTVAIKVIRPDIASDEKYAAMFIDEANVAMAIEHPNVCRTHELGHEGSVLYMAMEWVAGDSLAGLLRKGRDIMPLDPCVAARIVADALAGLHAAHEACGEDGMPLGVIHRDVSPPNILISLSGQVKVSDFGIAKARHQLHERTKTGEVKGKFAYLAPEQITGRGADKRIDIYAMGCVLYVAATGLRPFGNGPEAMTKILKGQVKRPGLVRADFPLGLEEVIMRAIEKDPNDRYTTAAEMRRALETWLISQRRVVTQSHVSQVLQDRLPESTRTGIEQLKAREVGQLQIDQEPIDESTGTEPPTASTKVVDLLGGDAGRGSEADSDGDGDSTVRYVLEPINSQSQTTFIDPSLCELSGNAPIVAEAPAPPEAISVNVFARRSTFVVAGLLILVVLVSFFRWFG